MQAAPLLAAAPIILTRGNHEDCTREGLGWLRLMSPQAFDPQAPCAAHVAPLLVPLGDLTMAVLDTASAPETDLAELFITAQVTRAQGEGVTVTRTHHHKCGRCWRCLPEVTEDGALCARCDEVVTEMEASA